MFSNIAQKEPFADTQKPLPPEHVEPPRKIRFLKTIPREERHLTSEDKERRRLRERDFGFMRHPEENDLRIFHMDKSDPGYLGDRERFEHDFAASEHQRLHAKHLHEQQRAEFIRRQREQRIAEHEQNELQQKLKEQQKWQQIRTRVNNTKASANRPSVPYNPLTLEYQPTTEGMRLKYQDDRMKWRARCRARALQKNWSSSVNPLTGEKIYVPPEPEPPAPFDPSNGETEFRR
ncbi:MAG: hypothetical protein MHM6MM_002663 [Cercozoa sp. M6MM]